MRHRGRQVPLLLLAVVVSAVSSATLSGMDLPHLSLCCILYSVFLSTVTRSYQINPRPHMGGWIPPPRM